MKKAKSLIAIFILTGCISQPTYSKLGGTQDQEEQAIATCRIMSANQQPAFNGGGNGFNNMSDSLGNIATSMTFTKNCMRAQGWKEVE